MLNSQLATILLFFFGSATFVYFMWLVGKAAGLDRQAEQDDEIPRPEKEGAEL